MGGRGSFALKKKVAYTFKTQGKIKGIKILQGINGKHGLPEEAHSSLAYIQLKRDGIFHELRIYDKDHYLLKEIAYHPEPKLNNGNHLENVLHVHEYPEKGNFKNRTSRLIRKDEYKFYKEYFKGVPRIDKW